MHLVSAYFRKWYLLLVPLILSLLLVSPTFASSIQIKINETAIKTPVAPVIEDGTTLVPLRVISENLGCSVNFNDRANEITILKDNKTIVIVIGQRSALVQGVTHALSVIPKTINNTTMVPLRFISEALDCTVDWNNKTQIISITSKEVSHPIATLKIKDYGTVTLELYPEMAPNTVNNFIALANSGYYDGITFHRVIDGFMIQGGDPTATGSGGPGYAINGEFSSNGFTQNTLSHTKGVISMARTYLPDSAGSQFFIMSADGTYLDGEYAGFGRVISGIEVIDKVQSVATDILDKPLQDVVIESLRVDTQGITYNEPLKCSK